MSYDVSDLRGTIVPKSDQLNSEQLMAGPITVTVREVSIGSDDQPLVIHHDKDAQRPFKPCKTMRKVLIHAWGPDGREWAGKSMTLFNDPTVRFGGAEVGGIRISHLTDIPADIEVRLTATKGKKALHTIRRMQKPTEVSEDLQNAAQTASLDGVAAYRAWFTAQPPAIKKALQASGDHDKCKAAAEEVDKKQA
jgi:hypothetical protein